MDENVGGRRPRLPLYCGWCTSSCTNLYRIVGQFSPRIDVKPRRGLTYIASIFNAGGLTFYDEFFPNRHCEEERALARDDAAISPRNDIGIVIVVGVRPREVLTKEGSAPTRDCDENIITIT